MKCKMIMGMVFMGFVLCIKPAQFSTGDLVKRLGNMEMPSHYWGSKKCSFKTVREGVELIQVNALSLALENPLREEYSFFRSAIIHLLSQLQIDSERREISMEELVYHQEAVKDYLAISTNVHMGLKEGQRIRKLASRLKSLIEKKDSSRSVDSYISFIQLHKNPKIAREIASFIDCYAISYNDVWVEKLLTYLDNKMKSDASH